MIKTESLVIGGQNFIRTYSNAHRYVVRDGVEYEEAIDLDGSGRTYTEGNILPEGGVDPDVWIRPDDWPDLDRIVTPNYVCAFLTYDLNKCSPDDWYMSVYFRGDTDKNHIAELGHLDDNYNFVVDKTFSGTTYWNSWTFLHTLDPEDGMVQLWRIRNSGVDTQFVFLSRKRTQTKDAWMQPCVEALFVNGTTRFTSVGNAGHGKTNYLESVRFKGNNSGLSCYQAFYQCASLRRIVFGSGAFTDFRNTINNCINLSELDYGSMTFTTTGNASYTLTNNAKLKKLSIPGCSKSGSTTGFITTLYGLEYLDLRNLDVSEMTNLQNGFIANLPMLKELNMDGLDFDSDTATSVFNPSDHYPIIEELYPPIIYRSQTWNQPTLTRASLLRLMNTVPTVESKTLTIGVYNQDKLTAAELAIATQKGWTVA